MQCLLMLIQVSLNGWLDSAPLSVLVPAIVLWNRELGYVWVCPLAWGALASVRLSTKGIGAAYSCQVQGSTPLVTGYLVGLCQVSSVQRLVGLLLDQ